MAKEKWFINEGELDAEQYKIKDLNPEKSFTIQGCAGSGKTILALWKAKYHQEMGHDYLLIVYTSALKKFIEDGVQDIGIETKRVLTYDNWKKVGYKSADFIIVDEAQDFSKSEILLLKSSAKISIMYFGDTVQQLYDSSGDSGEPTISMEEIAEITDAPLRILLKNYRLPKPIAKFAQRIPKVSDELERKCVRTSDTLPYVLKLKDKAAELDFIIQAIKKDKLKDVGILVPKNTEVEEISDYFVENGIIAEAKYSTPTNWSNSLNFVSDHPKIMTYHSSKGLQFEKVFVPFCETDSEFFRNSLYVAVTRPYNELYISYSLRMSAFISGIPKSFYHEAVKERTEDLPF